METLTAFDRITESSTKKKLKEGINFPKDKDKFLSWGVEFFNGNDSLKKISMVDLTNILGQCYIFTDVEDRKDIIDDVKNQVHNNSFTKIPEIMRKLFLKIKQESGSFK